MTGLFFMFFSVIVSKSVKECPAKAVALEFDPQKTQKASCFARRNSVARASSVAPELPRGEPPAPPLALPPDGWGAVGTGAGTDVGASLAPHGEPPAPPLALPPDGGGAVGTGAASRRGRRRDRRRVLLSYRMF